MLGRLGRSLPVWLVLAALGCGSSDAAGGSGGSPGSGGAGGTSAGAGGALSDAGQDASGIGPYPTGPYGNQQGDVLADLEMQGYLRHETTGFAYQEDFTTVRLSDVRATAPVAHAVIHISGFT